MKFARELIKGSTKSLILAVVAENELHGYQIVKAIREKSAEALEFGEGSVYPALHALERDGLLASRWETLANGRERKYYALTKKGRGVLKDAIKEWQDFSTAVNSVLNDVKFSTN